VRLPRDREDVGERGSLPNAPAMKDEALTEWGNKDEGMRGKLQHVIRNHEKYLKISS